MMYSRWSVQFRLEKSHVVTPQAEHTKNAHLQDAAGRRELGVRPPPRPLDDTITATVRLHVAAAVGNDEASFIICWCVEIQCAVVYAGPQTRLHLCSVGDRVDTGMTHKLFP